MENESKLPRVSFYSLEFTIDPEKGVFSSKGEITFINETDEKFVKIPFLLYHDLKIKTIKDTKGNELIYKQEIVPVQDEEKYKVNYIVVKLPKALVKDNSYTIYIEYSGSLNGYTEIMQYVKDSININFSILREDCFAYPILAYPDGEHHKIIIYDKFNYKLDIIVPNKYTVGCGGVLQNIKDEENKKKFTYISKFSTWRFDITISEYDLFDDSEMNLKIFAFAKDKSFSETKLKEEIKRAYNYFTSIFGDYPDGSYYTIIEIPEGYGSQSADNYIMMEEHAFNDNSRLTHLYHEIGHAWNSNAKPSIQRTRFFDEAFACYFEALAIREFYGDEAYKNRMELYKKSFIKYVERDKINYSTPISNYGKFDIGYNSYSKGPWVLYTLHKIVGDQNFFIIIKEFLNRFKNKNVDFKDFQLLSEEISNINLDKFFNEWIYGIESSKCLCEKTNI